MTQTMREHEQRSAVAERLLSAREGAGLSLEDAAAATGLLRSYLASLEDGRRRPLAGEVQRLTRVYGTDLTDLLPPRRPVHVDRAARAVEVDGHLRQVGDPTDEREVYAAYLFLLYALRGAQPGARLALRSSDLERLAAVVGEDAEIIERRLVQLMGCSTDEAATLRHVLLQHRAAAGGAQPPPADVDG